MLSDWERGKLVLDLNKIILIYDRSVEKFDKQPVTFLIYDVGEQSTKTFKLFFNESAFYCIIIKDSPSILCVDSGQYSNLHLLPNLLVISTPRAFYAVTTTSDQDYHESLYLWKNNERLRNWNCSLGLYYPSKINVNALTVTPLRHALVLRLKKRVFSCVYAMS